MFHVGYKITSTNFCFESYGIRYYDKWTTVWKKNLLPILAVFHFYHNLISNCDTVMFTCILRHVVTASFDRVLMNILGSYKCVR